MGSWAQVGVLGMVNLLTAAVTYGMLVGRQREHERRLNDNDKDQKAQWQSIGHVGVDVAKIKGKLGLNGA